MTHEHAATSGHDKHVDANPADRVHMDRAVSASRISDDPAVTYKKIEALAKQGVGSARDLPTMVSSLSDEYKIKVQDLLPALAKRISGDALLDVGEIVRDRIDFTIANALHARPPVTDAQLRRHLRSLPAESMAWLGDNEPVLDGVRQLMPGPFGVELPRLAGLPKALHGKPLLVAWYLAKTDRTIVALQLSEDATAELAHSLDQLKEWSWLADLHVGHGYFHGKGLEVLRDATSNATTKTKIASMLGTFDSNRTSPQDSETGQRDLAVRVQMTSPAEALLDAGARAMSVPAADHEKVLKRLKGEPARVVLEFSIATSLDLTSSIPLLASSTGVTSEHMQALLLKAPSDVRAAALTKDALRAHVRRVVGRKTSLTSFFPDPAERATVHAALYTDEALREWAYQENDPETNLWLAAGGPSARAACRLVRREIGLAWAHKVTATASAMDLRRFVLNCEDPKAAQHVRDHVLGDRTFKVDAEANQAVTISPDTYGRGDKARLDVAVLVDGSAKAVLERLADMTPTDRAALLHDQGAMQSMFRVLSEAELVRAVFLLGPTFSQLLGLPVVEPGLIDYVRTRPMAEQDAVLVKGTLTLRARQLFPHLSPFLVYPSLHEPSTLAKALMAAPELLTWMLDDADPSFALGALAREPVRTVAAPLFEARAHMYEKLPQYKHLLPAGKRGFDALSAKAENEGSKREAEIYVAGDATLDPVPVKQGERMAAASAKATLWEGIDELAVLHGTQESALALVNNASARERIALLDGSHSASVASLRALVLTSPHHVFTTLTTSQLLALPDAAAWLFEVELPYVTLGRIAHQPKALEQLGHALESSDKLAHVWIRGLPQGAALTANERQALDALCSKVTNESVLRLLFHARYGVAVDTTFSLAETKRLWGVLARLPPAQINQRVIRSFMHAHTGDKAAGLWDQENVVLNEDRKTTDGMDASYEDSPLLNAAEIKKQYGLDDQQLAKVSGKDGWISHENNGYRVKPVNTSAFTATVLHEVGHSVDTLLGEHTELIYGMGGWKRYGVDQLEEWATEMGALKGIAGRDRGDVIAAWKESLRAGQPVSEMVDDKHPARSSAYASDPLIAAGAAGKVFNYKETPREPHNGRVFTTNGAMLSSVPKVTADVAPSQYAMSAPAEYFAECYVEYYREYNGTPATEDKKGGHLATWIKQWFDKHVDSIRLSPDRLHGNAETERGTPNKHG
jgi:hypothetical protein